MDDTKHEVPMPTSQAASLTVQAAVPQYFAGERSEIWIAMAVALVVAASAVWLFVLSRSGFAMGLMATVVLFGSLMRAGLGSLMIRDHMASQALTDTLQTDQYATAISEEQVRIGVVLSKSKYYRLGAAILGVLALAGLMSSGREWIHGIAAGLLLVVVAQMVIDHFSERRAHFYFQKLTIVQST